MKKSLIALAVAGAMTAPMVAQADATLYGKFEMRVVSAKDRSLEVQSDDFRVGIKGDSELNSGAKAIYGLETELNPDASGSYTSLNDTDSVNTTVRKAFIGATGDFGTVLIGRIANPAEAVVAKVGNWSESASAWTMDPNPDFLGSAVAYVTPDMNGFNAYAAIVAEGGDDSQDDTNAYVIGGNYNADALSISAAYWAASEDYLNGALVAASLPAAATGDLTYTGISGSYDLGVATVALAYQDIESDLLGTTKNAASYDVTSALVSGDVSGVTLWANYHDYDFAVETATGQYENEFGIGAAYSLGAQASLDVEFVSAEGAEDQDDNDIFSVGYTVKF